MLFDIFRLLFVALLSTLISFQASANDYFQKDTDVVMGEPDAYKNIQNSVFQTTNYGMNPYTGSSCTNSYISKSGHYLTALHCLKTCLDQHGALVGTFAPIHSSNGTVVDGFLGVDYDIMKGKSCSVKFAGETEKELVEFVAGGPGLPMSGAGPLVILSSYAGANIELVVQLIQYGTVGNLDFAILRRKTDKVTACLKMGEQSDDELTGQSVWGLSYPSATGWVGDNLSDGKTKLVSTGSVLASYKNHLDLKTYVDKIPIKGDADTVSAMKDYLFNLDSMRITDVPVTVGSSGGALLDSAGSIVGVSSFVFSVKTKRTPGVTYMTTASAIKTFMYDFFPEANPDRVFDCP